MNLNKVSRREMIVGTTAGLAGSLLAPFPATAHALPAIGQSRRSANSNGALRFGVIADVHQDVMHDGQSRLDEFLNAMNESQPDFILQLGDFCVPHERNDAFIATWNEYKGTKHHVIGNHETDGGYSREQVVEYFDMPSRYYSFDQSGVHFVVLDGNDRGGTSGGYPRFVGGDQIKWLRDDLASTGRPTIVLIHQPLDSTDGVDNRALVRSILEESNQTPGHANVIAVLAGHSHVDYCRSINGIYYVLVNSASYQWVSRDNRHQSYAPEIHARATSLEFTCPYRDPLWATFAVDLENQTIEIEGRSTEWVGPSPVECGADYENGHWGWDPLYSQPRISNWRFPLRSSGDLG